MKLLDYHRVRAEEEKSWDRNRLEQEAGIREQVDALIPRTRGEFRPHGLIDIQWDETSDRMARLCSLYRAGTPAQRTYIRSRVDQVAAGRLEAFALRSAVAGAREHSAERIRTALAAFAMADLAGGDVRDSIIGVTLVFHCGQLAGGDAVGLFNEAAAMCGPAMEALLKSYTEPGTQAPGIGSMGWYQVDTPDGVGFTMFRPKPSDAV